MGHQHIHLTIPYLPSLGLRSQIEPFMLTLPRPRRGVIQRHLMGMIGKERGMREEREKEEVEKERTEGEVKRTEPSCYLDQLGTLSTTVSSGKFSYPDWTPVTIHGSFEPMAPSLTSLSQGSRQPFGSQRLAQPFLCPSSCPLTLCHPPLCSTIRPRLTCQQVTGQMVNAPSSAL